ncbi:MAG: translation elongation factor Ts [Anaerolineae bacterium]
MPISTETIKSLRELTGAGVLDCKRALEQSGGDPDRAAAILREQGLAAAAKKASRAAREGYIEAYIHPGAKVASLVELDCETDFVARTPEFRSLAHDLAMQVAATKPLYVSVADVPPEVVEAEKREYRLQIAQEDKPEAVREQIVEGKLAKFYQQVCLLEQPFIKDESVRIGDLITQIIHKLGENVIVRRFVRFAVGEE